MSTATVPSYDHAAIRHAFAQARREGKARHRDIAAALKISEGELIAAHAGLPPPNEQAADSPLRATRLRAPWPALIESLEPVGEVMALTRNESCVHEKTGIYREASHSGVMGLVLGGAIDLRVFYGRWALGFAVDETIAAAPAPAATHAVQTSPATHAPGAGHAAEAAHTAPTVQRSLQFFDAAGGAIHKIFLREATVAAEWDALVARFTCDDRSTGITPVAPAPAEPERPDARVDVEAFRIGWAAMADTHEFFGLLRRHGVTRTQALRLADPRFVEAAPPELAERVLHDAARDGVPIMVFVGNPGMIQIHGGPIQRVAVMGPWLNVLDPGFNLHLRADHIASAFIVRKPTSDGIVTSLELFDAKGDTIAMLFGERKPGTPELAEWRHLVRDARAALAGECASCSA